MNRLLLTTCLLLYTLATFAQKSRLEGVMPLENGEPVYTEVVAVEGVGKDELFDRAIRWVATTYPKESVQLSDKEGGSIIVKGALVMLWQEATVKRDASILHLLTLDIKDGKYRYRIDNMSVFVDYGISPSLYGEPATRATKTFTFDRFINKWDSKRSTRAYLEQVNQRLTADLAKLKETMAGSRKDF